VSNSYDDATTQPGSIESESKKTVSQHVGNRDHVNSNEQPARSDRPASLTDQDATTPRRSIQIGSQRDAANVALKPSHPKAVQKAIANPVELQQDFAPPPPQPAEDSADRSEQQLAEATESEIEAALQALSMDSVLGRMGAGEFELERDTRIKATISRIHGGNAFVTLKGHNEGILPLTQFKTQPHEGQIVEVVVKGRNEDDGLYEVFLPGAAVSISDWEDLRQGETVSARIIGSNTGGLEAIVNNVRGFIPASQIERFRVENFGDYVNQKMDCVVTEVNAAKKRLVLSRRAILERQHEEARKLLLESLAIGNVYDGTVTKLMDFGAFVDIGGVEGLLHVSKLSWDHVSHPKEILSPGEKIKVRIEKIDHATGKMSLSHRDTLAHPWDNIDQKYAINATVAGVVTRIADFGAFVRLEPGVEGLVHISEIAHHRVMKVGNHLHVGDQVQAKVLSIDLDKQKMSLSIKATQAPPAVKEKKSDQEDVLDDSDRQSTVAPSDRPLKGGTNRRSGGEQFGLHL
jgi:small subunit ribosomal protein S1